MAFLYRVNQSKLKLLSRQFKRHYVQTPFEYSPKYIPTASRSSVVENPVWGFCRRPAEFCYNVRFFAAPFQKKVKQEDDDSGPRLNGQIRARYVRLVSDEGHCIVSLAEALEQAKKHGVDLVEVQRRADPPVCKIMDFNKEMYMRELKAKELSKSKAGVTLRKGSCKEVRFAEKTEEKDLKMKADTVIRLMERGYRVKCVALSSQKNSSGPGDEDEQDNRLGALLSRLTSLIEDVAVVESGPLVEKRQAYAIVRHIKFGPSKKGGAKKSKNAPKITNVPPIANGFAPAESYAAFEDENAESGVETEDEVTSEEDDNLDENLGDDRITWSVLGSTKDIDEVFKFSDGAKALGLSHPENGSAVPEASSFTLNHSVPNFSQPGPVQDVKRADGLPSSLSPPSIATENRYKRIEPRNQFPPTKSADGRMDRSPSRFEPQFSNQRRQPQPPINVEPRNQFPPTKPADSRMDRSPPRFEPQFSNQGRQLQPPINVKPRNQFPPTNSADSRMDRSPPRFEPQFSNQRRQPQPPINANPYVGERNQAGADSTSFGNLKQPPNGIPKQTSPPDSSSTRSSSYGIFSSSKPSPPGRQDGESEVNKIAGGDRYGSRY